MAEVEALFDGTVLDYSKRQIRFPRTDAPKVPFMAEDTERYEYFEETSPKVSYWKKTIGKGIAERLRLSKPDNWKLASLPAGYRLRESYPDNTQSYTNDMFCDPRKIYSKPAEFTEHAFWLCCDPQLYACQCRFCTSRALMEDPSAEGVAIKVLHPDPWEAYSDPWRSSAYQRVWKSDLRRQEELDPIHLDGKNSQVLRYHELVWFILPEPLIGPGQGQKITHWPAHVSQRTVITTVKQDPSEMDVDVDPSAEYENDLDLDGNVVQTEQYRLQLLGLRREAYATRDLLVSQLAYHPPESLLSQSFSSVDPESVAWMGQGKRPKWHIAPSLDVHPDRSRSKQSFESSSKRIRRRPSFEEALPAFNLAVCILSYLRNAVVACKPLELNDSIHLWDATKSTSVAQQVVRKEAQTSIRNSWIVLKRNLWPEFGPLNTDARTDRNIYYQGVMLGADRIWTADIVRVDVRAADIERLCNQIHTSGAGTLHRDELTRLMRLPRAVLLDLDAIIYPAPMHPQEAKRDLLFCGALVIALHRERDASLIAKYGPWIRATPYEDLKPFSLEWTRPRNTLIYSRKTVHSPDMVFLPLLQPRKGHVAALPCTLLAGRWYASPSSLRSDPETALAYSALMERVDKIWAENEDPGRREGAMLRLSPSLSSSERDIVLAGWGPGALCSMMCQQEWDSLLDIHDQAERAARVEVWRLITLERERRQRTR
ncbi:hypothetical protein OC846_001578 [Tilletia horrida]|uniref:Cryptic loci regulator 2 N-terminal domain-containing protein n=1 Tax=Tilletia horrida TaxID=155126 RepID=A0AAN6JVS4_9BASI|nr:hypothetical protein OC846_001578 [Tilletia horrida]